MYMASTSTRDLTPAGVVVMGREKLNTHGTVPHIQRLSEETARKANMVLSRDVSRDLGIFLLDVLNMVVSLRNPDKKVPAEMFC